MPIIVKCSPDDHLASSLRAILCRCCDPNKPGFNPLVETPFNSIIEQLAQRAFEEGRAYERNMGKNS